MTEAFHKLLSRQQVHANFKADAQKFVTLIFILNVHERHHLSTAEVSEKAREVMGVDRKVGNGRESVSGNNKENR